MADTWIESHVNIRTNKKLKPLCDELKISRAQAIGHLHMLWWWVIENRENGDLSNIKAKEVAKVSGWGKGHIRFFNALVRHGWVVDGRIADWSKIGNRFIQRRRSAANHHAARRARIKASPIVERVDRSLIVLRDKSICYICKKLLKTNEVTLDHVIPLAKGGHHSYLNLRVACRPCNSRKGHR